MAVLINGRTAVHKDSKGTLTTIDPCYTGPQRQVVNYQNVAKSSDAANTAKTVFINGNPVCHKNSYFACSYGDEAGDGGGVKSGTICGKAEFVTASSNVFIEGIPAVRQGDKMVSNNRNTEPAPLMQPGVPFKGDQEKINQFPKMPYPKLEFDLSELPLIHFIEVTKNISYITVALNGNLILQQLGETNPLTFDMNGYKISARNSLEEFFNTMTTLTKNNKQMGIGSTIAGDFWSTQVEFQKPNKWIFTASPQPINKPYKNWIINGTLGFCMTVETYGSIPPLLDFLPESVLNIGEKIGEKVAAFLIDLIIATWSV